MRRLGSSLFDNIESHSTIQSNRPPGMIATITPGAGSAERVYMQPIRSDLDLILAQILHAESNAPLTGPSLPIGLRAVDGTNNNIVAPTAGSAGRAGAVRARGDQRPLAFELEEAAHAPILNFAFCPSSRREKVRTAGLPGNAPVTLARTMVRSCSSRISQGSAVCR